MRVRELAILVFLTIFLSTCGPAVRDKKVYEAEIDFMEAAAAEQVGRGIALIDEACKCEEIAGVKGFVTKPCQELAETILVVKYRMAYHTAFMRYLGGIDDRRPPKEPLDVPDTNALCPGGDPLPEIPVRPPEKLDDLEDEADAGTD